jgi:hypothetical protein
MHHPKMKFIAALSISFCTFLAAQDAGLQAKAEAARAELAGKLMGRLQEVLKTQGPDMAIDICQREAPVLAEQVGQRHGIRIGRTSMKLRNPSNRTPAWAESMVATKLAEPQFLKTSDGGLRALLPIHLGQACLTCHGPDTDISPGVRSALQAKYPQDRATGYQVGELRGWFWVEVPGRKLP